MRINKLELTRYGAFTDHVIDFGNADTGCDFHVVYGPNEAGKSTLRDAVIDFLFGFPRQTPYNFIHSNDALLLGATINAAKETHQLVRVKRNKASLLTVDNQPASEDLLKSVLGDISRAGFANMFSLDEDTLEAGGENILRSEGDIGELLFSAAAGLSSLSGQLELVRADASTFYKKPGRSHRLAEMKKELAGIKGQIRDHDVPASRYDALVKQERLQRKRHADAEAERDKNAARIAKLKVLLDCVDLWREYLALSEDFAQVKDAPDLPPDWLEEADRLATENAAVKTKYEEISRTIERTQGALDAIEIDNDILNSASRVERLTKDDTEAKFLTSKDIASRQNQLTTFRTEIDGLVKRLAAPNTDTPESLLLPAATIGRIKELTGPRTGLEANATSAAEEVERTEDKLQLAKEALAKFADISDLAELSATLARVRDDGDDRESRLLGKRCDALRNDLSSALATLKPWTGELADLLVMPVPHQSAIEALRAEQADIQALDLQLKSDSERLQDERSRLNAEIEAERSSVSAVEDAEALSVRAARDSAWQAHRDVFQEGEVAKAAELRSSAAVVEAAIREDDHVTQSRFLQTAEIATLRKLRVDLARCEADIERNAEKQRMLTKKQAGLSANIAQLAKSLSLPKGATIAVVESWRQDREKAISIHRELKEALSDEKEVKTRLDLARDSIAAAMSDAQIDSGSLDWKRRVQRCEKAIADWKRETAAKEAADESVNEAALELKDRKRQHAKAQKSLNDWEASWAEALKACWLGADDRKTSPAEAQEILDTLAELAVKLDKASELTVRIEAMQTNRDAYQREVAELATEASETMDPEDPLKTADLLRSRVATARENERRHKDRQSELTEATERLDAVTAARDRIDNRFAEMAGIFPGEDFTALIAHMRRSEKKELLQAQLAKLVQQLTQRLGTSDIGEIEGLLADTCSDPDALLAVCNEHDALTAASADVNEHVSALYHDWKKAETELAVIGDDSLVAKLEEESRVLLLDIRSEAERFVALSAGTMLVDRALDSYLATHRSSMLVSASEAFSAITRGAFSGLAAMPGKGSEVLVGLRRDGTSIIAPEMSRGTRFQLYLGLRIAGYREFVKHREPLPFFADDILETFDDDRSAETFSQMASMAKEGQVIYLTHHRHLCEIAKQVCKKRVIVHELPDRAVEG